MKRIALLLLLLTLLTACAGTERIPPAPAETSTPPPTVTPTPAPTETPVPTPTKVDVRVNIPAEVEQMVGGETYQGFVESIGESGEIRVTDYEGGRPLDLIIAPETVRVSETADWRFKQVVTAEAKAKYGSEVIQAVWNPETGKWVRVTEVNPEIVALQKSSNRQDYDPGVYDNFYTYFKYIDEMVETGDLDLVLLAQGDFGEYFPDDKQQPEYWIGMKTSAIKYPAERNLPAEIVSDTFFFMFPTRKEGTFKHPEVGNGYFYRGSEPFRYVIVKGRLSNGKEIYLVNMIIQNGKEEEKENIIVKLGFDPRIFEHMFTSEESLDRQGDNGLEDIFNKKELYLVPIIPTDRPEDWGNFENNGGKHGIYVNPNSIEDDVVVGMQKPGEVFAALPEDMQAQLRDWLGTLDKEITIPVRFVIKFPDGRIPEDLKKWLSRHISEAGFWRGSPPLKK